MAFNFGAPFGASGVMAPEEPRRVELPPGLPRLSEMTPPGLGAELKSTGLKTKKQEKVSLQQAPNMPVSRHGLPLDPRLMAKALTELCSHLPADEAQNVTKAVMAAVMSGSGGKLNKAEKAMVDKLIGRLEWEIQNSISKLEIQRRHSTVASPSMMTTPSSTLSCLPEIDEVASQTSDSSSLGDGPDRMRLKAQPLRSQLQAGTK
eukprot:TRINITY_DN99017_c0_g1_i1.p1 TRINITY_DN99017_c0_g1~~TRINITY_DN99017_c0_g1_i1.p1  ORF type:complete len:205 (-),score=57.31 TRINITY_DN99017_c0_g1_i1:106-720(-)